MSCPKSYFHHNYIACMYTGMTNGLEVVPVFLLILLCMHADINFALLSTVAYVGKQMIPDM